MSSIINQLAQAVTSQPGQTERREIKTRDTLEYMQVLQDADVRSRDALGQRPSNGPDGRLTRDELQEHRENLDTRLQRLNRIPFSGFLFKGRKADLEKNLDITSNMAENFQRFASPGVPTLPIEPFSSGPDAITHFDIVNVANFDGDGEKITQDDVYQEGPGRFGLRALPADDPLVALLAMYASAGGQPLQGLNNTPLPMTNSPDFQPIPGLRRELLLIAQNADAIAAAQAAQAAQAKAAEAQKAAEQEQQPGLIRRIFRALW